MMLNIGESFKIDFTATDNMGKTGLQLAEDEGRNANIVNMIKRKMESIAQEEELENRNKKRKKNQKHQKKRFEIKFAFLI